MAHGDYVCCAVCDCKMNYEGMTDNHKEDICSACLKDLHKNQIMVYSTDEFIGWIEKQEEEELAKMLIKIGFNPCWYSNRVEDAINKIAGIKEDGRFKNAREWLEAIGVL